MSRTVCPGCSTGFHLSGWKPLVCHTSNRVGHLAEVCKSRKPPSSTPRTSGRDPATKAISAIAYPARSHPTTSSSGVHKTKQIEPAPTFNVHFSTVNGSAMLKALPDSGADISVARTQAAQQLGGHTDNPSEITHRTVSGHKMPSESSRRRAWSDRRGICETVHPLSL